MKRKKYAKFHYDVILLGFSAIVFVNIKNGRHYHSHPVSDEDLKFKVKKIQTKKNE
jgi:hypothetical protein